jgi:hypothetical protein
MADQIRILDRLIQAKPFDLRALLRLATWGCVAAVALMLAVLSSSIRSKHQTFVAPTATPQVPAATVALTTRQSEPDKAARQLSEAVSGLTADRDRLVARIASLERNLEDVTGSIKQQAVAAPASATVPAQTSVRAPTVGPAPTAAPARDSVPAREFVPAQAFAPAAAPGPGSSPRPSTSPAMAPAPAATVSSPTPPSARSQPQPEKTMPAPAATAPPPPGAIAASPSAPAAPPAAAPPPASPTRVANLPEAADPEGKSRIVDFGLDVGGATTFDGLRALWNSVRNNTADLFEDLHPMVAVRENKSRGVDLRLVVGPIASSEAATQMCATLLAARRFCQMTIFEGQPLPQASAVTEPDSRRPPPAAPPRISTQSKTVRPPAPAPRP